MFPKLSMMKSLFPLCSKSTRKNVSPKLIAFAHGLKTFLQVQTLIPFRTRQYLHIIYNQTISVILFLTAAPVPTVPVRGNLREYRLNEPVDKPVPTVPVRGSPTDGTRERPEIQFIFNSIPEYSSVQNPERFSNP